MTHPQIDGGGHSYPGRQGRSITYFIFREKRKYKVAHERRRQKNISVLKVIAMGRHIGQAYFRLVLISDQAILNIMSGEVIAG